MAGTRLVLASGALAALVVRSRLRNWGTTPEERRRYLPGDELVAGEHGISTMATTIHASPAAVWPWLAQMGTDRGGWYSFDRLDNGGRPSADQVDVGWMHVKEGDRFTTVPGRAWFDVVHVEPCRSLVLRSLVDLRGHSLPADSPRPRHFTDARWEFFLEMTVDGGTRLLVRSGATGAPRGLTDIINFVFWHPAHLVMQLRQFAGLRARAEELNAAVGGGEPRRIVSAGVA